MFGLRCAHCGEFPLSDRHTWADAVLTGAEHEAANPGHYVQVLDGGSLMDRAYWLAAAAHRRALIARVVASLEAA